MGIHIFIDILPLVPHKFIPGNTVYPSVIQKNIESVAAVVRGVYGQDAAGLKSSVKVLTVLWLGDGLDSIMVNQAFEISVQAALHHAIYG